MKKCFLIMAVLFTATLANAQGHSMGCIVKGGVNFSNMVMGVMPHGMKVGGHVGAEWDYAFSSRFGVGGGLLLNFTGAKFALDQINPVGHYFQRDDGKPIEKDVDYSAIYFNIPVMAKFYITPNFTFDLGPQLGINVQNKFTSDGDKVKKVGRGLETMGADMVAGFTYFVNKRLVLQARYNLSLTKSWNDYEIDDTGTQTTYFNSDDRLQTIQLSVGVRF